MQLANILLAIGEDVAHTVPKYNMTPAEVAVLTAIHGANAVTDIEILDAACDTSPRELVSMLYARYNRATDDENKPVIRSVFPTVTSRVPTEFAELGLSDSCFTAKSLDAMNGEAPAKIIDDTTKAELVAFADENGIEINASGTKSVILAAIEAATKPDSALG